MKRLKSGVIIALALTLVLLQSCALMTPDEGRATVPASADFELIFIDVGQADAALVTCDGETMLVDGGNVADSDLIYSVLSDRGISHLDYVICTHAHEDHVGGLSGALNAATAGTVYAPVKEYNSKAFSNFADLAREQGAAITIPAPGDRFDLGSAEVQILGPLTDYDDPNNTSIVVKIFYGETSFLLTGDMERKAELDLIDAGVDLRADVLKVGHHGSSTSSSYVFLNEVMPSYAVISCGVDNEYGHPTDEVLSRLRDADVVLYRTDLQGDITCISDGEAVYFSTDKNSATQTNPTVSEAQDPIYIGNRNSKKLHVPSCPSLPAEQNQVVFNNLEEAYGEGYTNCNNCMS